MNASVTPAALKLFVVEAGASVEQLRDLLLAQLGRDAVGDVQVLGFIGSTTEAIALGPKPIDTAPKDRAVLVNDTAIERDLPWVAAKWLESPEWSGWIYDDEIMSDCRPLGPNPTHWLPAPSLAV